MPPLSLSDLSSSFRHIDLGESLESVHLIDVLLLSLCFGHWASLLALIGVCPDLRFEMEEQLIQVRVCEEAFLSFFAVRVGQKTE